VASFAVDPLNAINVYALAAGLSRGRADAKAKGVKFGRKPKLTPHQQREARERVAAGESR
jgi:hypothetical protein